jgi:hypothetical protein
MSRCGSTLVAQTLASLRDSVVLSEPPAFDTLLQWLVNLPTVDGDRGSALLQGLLSALGQPRRTEDRRLFVKTDCWHICHSERIFQAFPEVPWVFLYRDPLEVLVSQSRIPGAFIVPGNLSKHGLHPPEKLIARPLEHGAWVLGQVLRAADAAMREQAGGLLLNYSELPDGLDTRLARHFRLALGATDLAAWQAVRARDSKQPSQSFQPDAADKQASVNVTLREVAARWLDDSYARLERLRLESRQSTPMTA